MARILYVARSGIIDTFRDILASGFVTFEDVGVLDDDPALAGTTVKGLAVLGGTEDLESVCRDRGVDEVAVCLPEGYLGARASIFNRCRSAGIEPVTHIHATASIATGAHPGRGTVVGANAVIGCNVALGDNCIIWSGAIIEHDCLVGAHSYVSPGAVLCGHVSVGTCCMVGAGAVVAPGVTIGDASVVGAGSTVLGDVPPGVLAVGTPAVVKRESRLR